MIVSGLLPYATLIAIFFINKGVNLRTNYLYSSIIWGSLVAVSTLVMSLWKGISPEAILVLWILLFLCSMLLVVRDRISILWPRLPWFLWVLISLAAIPLMVGLLYPPNNWDSMTYHLPRIEHWLQNGSLAFYPTSIPRQNVMGQFAEIVLLQLRALSGSDIYYNSLQWVAYVSTIINVSYIAMQLGASNREQVVAAVIGGTIPMAVLQASSTQNDLIVSWWVTSLASLTLLWWKKGTVINGLLWGAALGLACMTKGTAYPFSFVFGVFFLVLTARDLRKRFFIACCAGVIFLMFNLPLFIQNYKNFANIWGDPITEKTLLQPSPKFFIANIVCNVAMNIDLPKATSVHDLMTNVVEVTLNKLNIDEKDFFKWGEFKDRFNYTFHEDSAQSIVHMVLFLFSIPFLFLSGNRFVKVYGCMVCGTGIVFCCVVAWQPWIARFQQTIFFLASPIVALVLCKRKFLTIFCLTVLVMSAVLTNLFNFSRPIFDRNNIKSGVAINLNREKNYFFDNNGLYLDYKDVSNKLLTFERIGLIIGSDSWEYPLWMFLREHNWKGSVVHVLSADDIAKVDAVFMLDSDAKFGLVRPKDKNPFIIPCR